MYIYIYSVITNATVEIWVIGHHLLCRNTTLFSRSPVSPIDFSLNTKLS